MNKLEYFITVVARAVKSVKESTKVFIMMFQTSLRLGLIIIKDHL